MCSLHVVGSESFSPSIVEEPTTQAIVLNVRIVLIVNRQINLILFDLGNVQENH